MWVAVCKELADQALCRLDSTLDLVIGIVDTVTFIQAEGQCFIIWQDRPLFDARSCIIIVEPAKVYRIWAKKLSFLCPELASPITAIGSYGVRSLDREASLKSQNYSCRWLTVWVCFIWCVSIRFLSVSYLSLSFLTASPTPSKSTCSVLASIARSPSTWRDVVKVPGHCVRNLWEFEIKTNL